MEKLYGKELRREAGLVKTIKRVFPPPVIQSVGKLEKRMDKVLAETQGVVEDFLIQVGPKFEQGVAGFVKDTKFMFSRYPAKLSITRLADDLKDYDVSLYKLDILNTQQNIPASTLIDPVTRKVRGHELRYKPLVINYGEPIHVKWTAAKNHSKEDWIGLYRIADNASREVTKIASMGRWVACCKDQHEVERADVGCLTQDIPAVNDDGEEVVTGEVVFEADKTFWVEGSYEFRYHHGGKHSVIAISLPFEIVVLKPQNLPVPSGDEDMQVCWTDEAVMKGVEEHLFYLVRNCFDRDEEKGAPRDVEEDFILSPGGREVEKYANRVVYAVKEAFGVDFAMEVVSADRNVRRLAWRICHAKKVLVSRHYPRR